MQSCSADDGVQAIGFTNRKGYTVGKAGQVYLHNLVLKIPPTGFSRRPALFAGIKKTSAAVTTEVLNKISGVVLLSHPASLHYAATSKPSRKAGG